MNRIFLNILTVFILLILCSQSMALSIADLNKRIMDAEKVEELYTLRYALNRIVARTDLTLLQQDSLRKAMIRLTDAFSDFRHFRNAADSYREFLVFNEKYLERHLKFFTDSIKSSHRNFTEAGVSKLNGLENEISALEKRQAAVSTLKGKYYLFGGIAAIAILATSIFLVISKSRSIRHASQKLIEDREQLNNLHHQVTETYMIQGTLDYFRDANDQSASLLSEMADKLADDQTTGSRDKSVSTLRKVATEIRHSNI